MLNEVVSRIETRLSALGLSAAAASRLADAPDAIRNLQRAARDGNRQGVSTSTMLKLAAVLQTSVEWLLEGKGPETREQEARALHIPILSFVQAGAFAGRDGVEDLQDALAIPVADLPPGKWFALRVEGDSMDRISPPGSIIIVNALDRRLVPNACYVIANEDGEATYKRYRPSPDRFEPVSVNPAHEPIYPIGPVRVIGRVRRSLLEM
jgi:SOS-response transcriptional repressor LexA